MSKKSYYAGGKVALLTKHGKERVISPVLERGLGCSIKLISGFDTDLLGTFTRDIQRSGTQLEAARRKAQKALELSGAHFAIASEGSFGPDPFTGMLPWNLELLVWIDNELDIEIVGMYQGPARNGHIQSNKWDDVLSFAEQAGFPDHQLVLRPNGQDDKKIYKNIDNWIGLKQSFESAVAESNNREVFVEFDLRAFANPTRMKNIEMAANDLLKRIQSTCPSCQAPGFWIKERQAGLPCKLCGLPTSIFSKEIWSCLSCEYKRMVDRDDQSHADPVDCAYCNP